MNDRLRDALSDQTLAHYNPELDVIITWNGHSTFNVYDSDGGILEAFTKYGADTNAGPCTPAEALVAIDEHIKEMSVTENLEF